MLLQLFVAKIIDFVMEMKRMSCYGNCGKLQGRIAGEKKCGLTKMFILRKIILRQEMQ